MQLPDFWLALANMNILPLSYSLCTGCQSISKEFKILLFVFKVLNGLAPSYLSDLLSLHSPARCLRSSNQKLLLVPRSRLKKKGDWAFAIAGPKLWNSLPVSIRTITTESLFKTRLKAYLFERAFSVWANRSLLFQIIICLVFTILCILIPFKLYCSAQWSTIVVLLCFINKINEIRIFLSHGIYGSGYWLKREPINKDSCLQIKYFQEASGLFSK